MTFHDLDLSAQLVLARRGTAHFLQQLSDPPDATFATASLLPGWSRQHVIAHVAYNAAALCRLLDWAATGHETPMYASSRQRTAEIAEATRLSGPDLRDLLDHHSAQLDHKWETLPSSAWTAPVRTARGRIVPASETIWMRCREVWVHAVDVDAGAGFSDIPPPVLRSLLHDVVTSWRETPGWSPADVSIPGRHSAFSATTLTTPQVSVQGTLASVVQWGSGRGDVGVFSPLGTVPAAPHWL